jgi:formylglycine-generating enzyme required for sulfatase activity
MPAAAKIHPASVTPVPPVEKSWATGMDFRQAGKGLGALAGIAIAALIFWQSLQGQNPLAFITLPLLDTLHTWEQSQPAVAGREPEAVPPPAGNTPAKSAPASSRVQTARGGSRQASAAQDTVDDAGAGEELPRVTAGRVFRDSLKGGGRGPQMVELPAAAFLMGSTGSSMNFDERPQHRVELAGYSIGKHEVSFADYDRFARATGRRLPYDEGWGRGDQPVINVSWKDARAYAGWLSKQTGHTYRLPTEAQWEFAARGGTSNDYWWDNDVDAHPANCFDCGNQWDGRRTTAVGRFAANPFGLHDTSGNVQEWVEDCYYANYEGAAADGSARQVPRCTQRVVRGGAYSSPVDSLRNTKRARYNQDTRLDNLGFRVVRVD